MIIVSLETERLTMKKERENNKYLLGSNVLGLILGMCTPFVDSMEVSLPFLSNKTIYLGYVFWCLSILLIIGPWIYKMHKLVSSTRGIIESADMFANKLNELSIWKKNEQVDKINITVSDLDDYLILMPLHLSVQTLKGMDVKIQTSCCGSDKKAIEKLLSGESKFAITDPYYLVGHENSDLILLAPIITESPMWWMSKENISGRQKKVQIFSYESEQKDTYTSRLLQKKINSLKLRPNEYEVFTIEDVVNQLNLQLKSAVDEAASERSNLLIEEYEADDGSKGLDGLKKDSKKISAFECLLFSCGDGINSKISTITREYFRQFDYFLVTEPDCSFIKKILSYKAESVSLDNSSIFTGLITTRHYMREFPVECLKTLRGLRDGIFRSNIVLMNKDAITIKNAFHDALMAFSKDKKAQYFKQALESIDAFMLSEKYFPDDLIVFDNTMTKYKKYNLNKFKAFLLRASNDHGKDSDFDNQSIKFIINGLGYDCK